MKKKKRIIKLPENCGIHPDELPTYVWYVKPEGTHNERFVVKIGDLVWKTTSSNKMSLRYKLEEAKAYLRKLKEEHPELFQNYSMNGDYNKLGHELFESFYDIIYLAGFKHIKKITLPNLTNKIILPQDRMPKLEKLLLETNVMNGGRKKIIKLIPKNIGITSLPEKCYYRHATEKRGDYFIIKKNGKTWSSSTSKTISTQIKYQQMLKFINDIK
jgi:hypothetical protein